MSHLSDFLILSPLGRGSFGVVHKVQRLVDSNIYVMKSIDLTHLSPQHQQQSINEVRLLAAVDSPYIVRYYDSFIEDNTLYLIMEYYDQGDLYKWYKNKQTKGEYIQENDILHIMMELSLGLHELHRNSICHRDLKSLNIFVSSSGHIAIGDLGVSKLLGKASLAKTMVGTPLSLAPELCEGKPYGFKTDLWALGILLYELATFRHPFEATNPGALIMKIIKCKYTSINVFNEQQYQLYLLGNGNNNSTEDITAAVVRGPPPKYSPRLEAIISSCLQRNPADRPSIVQLLNIPTLTKLMRGLGDDFKGRIEELKKAREKEKEKEKEGIFTIKETGNKEKFKPTTTATTKPRGGSLSGQPPPHGIVHVENSLSLAAALNSLSASLPPNSNQNSNSTSSTLRNTMGSTSVPTTPSSSSSSSRSSVVGGKLSVSHLNSLKDKEKDAPSATPSTNTSNKKSPSSQPSKGKLSTLHSRGSSNTPLPNTNTNLSVPSSSKPLKSALKSSGKPPTKGPTLSSPVASSITPSPPSSSSFFPAPRVRGRGRGGALRPRSIHQPPTTPSASSSSSHTKKPVKSTVPTGNAPSSVSHGTGSGNSTNTGSGRDSISASIGVSVTPAASSPSPQGIRANDSDNNDNTTNDQPEGENNENPSQEDENPDDDNTNNTDDNDNNNHDDPEAKQEHDESPLPSDLPLNSTLSSSLFTPSYPPPASSHTPSSSSSTDPDPASPSSYPSLELPSALLESINSDTQAPSLPPSVGFIDPPHRSEEDNDGLNSDQDQGEHDEEAPRRWGKPVRTASASTSHHHPQHNDSNDHDNDNDPETYFNEDSIHITRDEDDLDSNSNSTSRNHGPRVERLISSASSRTPTPRKDNDGNNANKVSRGGESPFWETSVSSQSRPYSNHRIGSGRKKPPNATNTDGNTNPSIEREWSVSHYSRRKSIEEVEPYLFEPYNNNGVNDEIGGGGPNSSRRERESSPLLYGNKDNSSTKGQQDSKDTTHSPSDSHNNSKSLSIELDKEEDEEEKKWILEHSRQANDAIEDDDEDEDEDEDDQEEDHQEEDPPHKQEEDSVDNPARGVALSPPSTSRKHSAATRPLSSSYLPKIQRLDRGILSLSGECIDKIGEDKYNTLMKYFIHSQYQLDNNQRNMNHSTQVVVDYILTVIEEQQLSIVPKLYQLLYLYDQRRRLEKAEEIRIKRVEEKEKEKVKESEREKEKEKEKDKKKDKDKSKHREKDKDRDGDKEKSKKKKDKEKDKEQPKDKERQKPPSSRVVKEK